jgi:DNA-binding NtrC family response regulator
LNVIQIHIPSLNERREDIPLLSNYFLHQICNDYNMKVLSIENEALKQLKKHNWTGNIRELRNVIERLVILCDLTIKETDVKKFVFPI